MFDIKQHHLAYKNEGARYNPFISPHSTKFISNALSDTHIPYKKSSNFYRILLHLARHYC